MAPPPSPQLPKLSLVIISFPRNFLQDLHKAKVNHWPGFSEHLSGTGAKYNRRSRVSDFAHLPGSSFNIHATSTLKASPITTVCRICLMQPTRSSALPSFARRRGYTGVRSPDSFSRNVSLKRLRVSSLPWMRNPPSWPSQPHARLWKDRPWTYFGRLKTTGFNY